MSHAPKGSPSPGSAADAALSMPLSGVGVDGSLEIAGEDDVRFARGPGKKGSGSFIDGPSSTRPAMRALSLLQFTCRATCASQPDFVSPAAARPQSGAVSDH